MDNDLETGSTGTLHEAQTMNSDDVDDVDFAGDYSTNMEDILGGDEEEEKTNAEEEEEGFLYEGVDAEAAGAYRDQLKDILGAEHEDDELEEQDIDRSSRMDDRLVTITAAPERLASEDLLSDNPSSTPSRSQSDAASPLNRLSPLLNDHSPLPSPSGTPLKLSRPYLHPTVSRLRSFATQVPPSPSAGSTGSVQRPLLGGSPAPSHLSALSADSSLPDADRKIATNNADSFSEGRQVFRWTRLKHIEASMFSSKAAAVLGSDALGSPTVLAANGMVCLGTSSGKVAVYSFKQSLHCVCGNDAIAKVAGPVTAIAFSHDHTFVASGHETGYILLYDLKQPTNPARTVVPTTLPNVRTGRQEGHIAGSRIVNIGFIAARHTAIVSADEHGLAFYHSLGKVLFVEASDTLRILGKYPEDPAAAVSRVSSGPRSSPRMEGPMTTTPFSRRRQQAAHAILAMSALPLGTTPHQTDPYQIIAILTPAKLVVVGLKPSPKTWYRCHRKGDASSSGMRWKGCMAWFPSTIDDSDLSKKSPLGSKNEAPNSSNPLLAYSWAETVHLLRTFETQVIKRVQNPRSGQVREVHEGLLGFEECPAWKASGSVLGLQWLNHNQVIVVTSDALELYDIRTQAVVERSNFNASTLTTPRLLHDRNQQFHYSGNMGDVAHSMRVYKAKIFLLGQDYLQVGTLLTWADHILACVETGDFLQAVDLARAYYDGDAPGNRNGLPDDPLALKQVVGQKLQDLMTASARFAFSEDRMVDSTHQAADGRGVDRTSLFEGLVSTCARACMALDNLDFLFEDLYQYYEDWGIAPIFLRGLEPFILNSQISAVPPRITQRLVTMLEEQGQADRAEKIIWHIDPLSLDIDQAIGLCQKFHLYDALAYVYTRGLQDYVAPVVQLLGLVRTVQQYRRAREHGAPSPYDDETIEPILINGYKIFDYLSCVLTGITYPGQTTMPVAEATQARNEVYTFLFFGRSTTWPMGTGGALVLTSDAPGGQEPTYPYLRLLLRFDTEALLHALDMVFEDPYLNEVDEPPPVNRLIMVKILLEVLASPGLESTDASLINIFIARNVPKYPQYIQLKITDLQKILVDLATDEDEETREDRQLAAEYLLSSYTPQQTRQLVDLFEKAGFFRILRRWHRQEHRWSALMTTYVRDMDLCPLEMFQGVDQTLATAMKESKGVLQEELTHTLETMIPLLLHADVHNTAVVIDRRAPTLHEAAVNSSSLSSDRWRLAYLRSLLAPPSAEDDDQGEVFVLRQRPSPHISKTLSLRFTELQCEYEPAQVRTSLEYLPSESVDWDRALDVCEHHGVFDVAVWGINNHRGPVQAMSKFQSFSKILSSRIVDNLQGHDEHMLSTNLATARNLSQEGVVSCIKATKVHGVEDMWFRLLDSEIRVIQAVATCASLTSEDDSRAETLQSLRSVFHDAFGSLMNADSPAVSVPRIFKRLVESATSTTTVKAAAYAEFRTILTGLLDAYRSDEVHVTLTAHLVDRDLFNAIEERTAARSCGWASSAAQCAICKGSIINAGREAEEGERIVIMRQGQLRHAACHTDVASASYTL